MVELQIYNTLSRKKEHFTPIDAKSVRLYVCGPTVYDYAHIGNARPVIVFDVLYRLLCAIYGQSHVHYARNITDVDDKINARAVQDFPNLPLNDAILQLTKTTNAQFQHDVTMLGCLEPTEQPRATDHLEDMRKMIERLIERGYAYVADDHVLFSVAKMQDHPRYGALAKRSLDEMIAGARVDVAEYKQDEMDFVLWKPSKQGEPGWPSPAGIKTFGRPGWHIECSAMSMAKLLQPFGGGLYCDDPSKNVFDIHGGGIDLVFPHHENEIAQSCSAFGTERMANYWMHNGFLQVEGQKMSKSLGNFITIDEVLKTELTETNHVEEELLKHQWAGRAARFSMLQTHYREPINWTAQRLSEASSELYRFYTLLRQEKVKRVQELENYPDFLKALGDDLNCSKAITLLRHYFKQGDSQALFMGLHLLGLYVENWVTDEDCALFKRQVALSEAEILEKIEKRLRFILAKDFKSADAIREELAAKNIILKDGKHPKTGERITEWDIKK